MDLQCTSWPQLVLIYTESNHRIDLICKLSVEPLVLDLTQSTHSKQNKFSA